MFRWELPSIAINYLLNSNYIEMIEGIFSFRQLLIAENRIQYLSPRLITNSQQIPVNDFDEWFLQFVMSNRANNIDNNTPENIDCMNN